MKLDQSHHAEGTVGDGGQSQSTDVPGALTGREVALFAALCVALVALALFLSDGGVLFTRPFWVDEWLIVFISGRSTVAEVIGDLAAGADGGASLLHLTFWLLRWMVGDLTPILVRSVSLASIVLALLVVFAILRRRFSFASSAVGALAVGAHPLVIAHSYEGRFYGPWLLASAVVAWLFARRQTSRPAASWRRRRQAVALAVAAFALCTTHSYGVVSLVILAAGALAVYGSRWREGIRDVVPAAGGILAIVIVVPLSLGQRSAYTVPTWLPDFSLGQLSYLLEEFWLVTIAVVASLTLVVAALLRWLRGDRIRLRMTLWNATTDAGIMALFALAAMPFALTALSLIGQPSMLSRYAILSALAWAPWVALAVEIGGKWTSAGMSCLVVWFWLAGYVRETSTKAAFAAGVHYSAQMHARALTADLPIVTYTIHQLYPLIGSDPGSARATFLDIPDSLFASLFPQNSRFHQFNRGLILERDLARVHADRWGFPRLVPLAVLDTTGRFLLLDPMGRLPAGFQTIEQFARTMFPQHRLTRLPPDLTLLERTGADPSSK